MAILSLSQSGFEVPSRDEEMQEPLAPSGASNKPTADPFTSWFSVLRSSNSRPSFTTFQIFKYTKDDFKWIVKIVMKAKTL